MLPCEKGASIDRCSLPPPSVCRQQDMYRRIRVLEADQKADPNVVEAVRRNRDMMEVSPTPTSTHLLLPSIW